MDNFRKYMPRVISFMYAFVKHIAVVIEYIAVQYLFFFITGIKSFSASDITFWKTFILIVVYFSTSFAFAIYNRQQCFIFLSKETKDIFPELLSFDFISDFVMTLFFFLCFSVELFSPLVIVCALISNLLNFISARRIWLKDKEDKTSTRLYEVRLIAHLVISVIGLFLFFFFASSLIPAVDTIIMIFRLLSYLIFLPIIYTVFVYIRALFKMRSFILGMKKFCKKNNIECNLPSKPYLSVFRNRPDNAFILKLNGKEYSCSIVSFSNIFLPVVFRTDGFFYRLSKTNLKNQTKPMISLERRYSHESDLPKIVIITSSPYIVMVQHGNKLKEFDTGDNCGDCKIFTLQGFLGAVERNTVDRKSDE